MPTRTRSTPFTCATIDGLTALPGTRAVGGTSFLPLAGIGPATSFWRADQPQPAPNDRPVVDARPVTAGYFTAMGIPLLAGRDVNENDTADRPPVAVINESFARQIYPGDNPIGRQFILNLGNEQAARDHRRGRRREAGQRSTARFVRRRICRRASTRSA